MCKDYVVCEERSNRSRIHWLICRDRCEDNRTCLNFQEKLQEKEQEGGDTN